MSAYWRNRAEAAEARVAQLQAALERIAKTEHESGFGPDGHAYVSLRGLEVAHDIARTALADLPEVPDE